MSPGAKHSITEHDRDMIALLRRSKPREDGWYVVSDMVWPLILKTNRDLFWLWGNGTQHEAKLVRLTARGQAVADYLL